MLPSFQSFDTIMIMLFFVFVPRFPLRTHISLQGVDDVIGDVTSPPPEPESLLQLEEMHHHMMASMQGALTSPDLPRSETLDELHNISQHLDASTNSDDHFDV